MAVKASGSPLALSEIQTEFGGSNPIGLNEYYRGGGLVPNGPSQNANIATAGAINVGSFYGSVRSFVFNQTISSNTANYNLRAAAVAAGWDQSTPLIATVTINAGVYVSGSSVGVYAFETGSGFPAGSVLSLVNNGAIIGAGGSGGQGAGAGAGYGGSSGGSALRAQALINVTNNGTIAGGGGGGGGGQGAIEVNIKTTGNSFGAGGGGGGRSNPAANAAGGSGGPAVYWGNSGGVGTVNNPGGGGGPAYNVAGYGGAGGAWGQPGSSGGGHVTGGYGSTGGPYGGGERGYFVVGNAAVNWVATGTRLGLFA